MTAKNIGLVLFALAALGAAGYMTMGYLNKKEVTEDFATISYLCIADKCGAAFQKTAPELLALQRSSPDGAVPCPTCGSMKTIQSVPCPKCAKAMPTVGHAQTPPKCPHCGADTGVRKPPAP